MTTNATIDDDRDDSDGPLFDAFLGRVVVAYAKTGLPIDHLGAAMLTKAVNLLIADMGEIDAAHLLAGLAQQILPPAGAAN